MRFSTFQLPAWVEGKGPKATYNLAGSYVPARSINDLVTLSSDPQTTRSNLDFNDLKLTYNSQSTGQAAFKANLASLYTTPVNNEQILTTTGTSLANQIVLQALIRPDDHVICVHPVYAQLYTTPRAIGAEVSFWRHRPSNDWKLEYDELENLVRDNTRMIIVNNPNNPTGSYLEDRLQKQVITLAKKHGLLVLADEIFRPLFHFSSSHGQATGVPKSFMDHAYDLEFPNLVVTGSMSKSYSFPGTRVGWIICRNATILSACENLRHLSLISVSPIDEMIASEALSPRCGKTIMQLNLETARKGRSILEHFVTSSHNDKGKYMIEWIKPQASTTTMIRVIDRASGMALNEVNLCDAAFEKVGLLLVPGSLCFDTTDTAIVDQTSEMEGWMRVSFVCEEKYLTDTLAVLGTFLETYNEELAPRL